MTDCTQESFEFPAVKRRKVEATFSGGEISSDGGVVLLREADRHLGLLEAASRVLHDPRDSGKVVHSQLSLLRQRVYGLCLGYEDLNDHQELRRDPAIQTAVERSEVLASQATLCRLEHRMDRQAAVALHRVLVEQFIASHRKPPRKLILAAEGGLGGGDEALLGAIEIGPQALELRLGQAGGVLTDGQIAPGAGQDGRQGDGQHRRQGVQLTASTAGFG